MTTGTLIVGFVASTVGFSLFLYGKKNARLPHLIVGMLLMLCPFVVPGAAWMAVVSTVLLVGLVVSVRLGW